MKKLLLMVALALTTLTVDAQEESKLTLTAGAGLSSVVGDDAETDNVFSYKVGLTYDFKIGENFSLVPGAEIVAKGYTSDWVDGNINMTYLQVPVLAAYKFNLTDDLKLAIQAGPYLSFGLFGSDIEFSDGYGDSYTINVFDSDGGYERFDAGIIGGVAVEFSKYVVGLEYSRGLKKLDSDVKQYNQAFGLTFGIKL